jgi:hypothetical protein
MPKICDLKGVRGGDTDFPVQLWVEEETDRLVIRGINEGGFSCVDIDLLDLIRWIFEIVPEAGNYDTVKRTLASRKHIE